jgi:hypothetical protein
MRSCSNSWRKEVKKAISSIQAHDGIREFHHIIKQQTIAAILNEKIRNPMIF